MVRLRRVLIAFVLSVSTTVGVAVQNAAPALAVTVHTVTTTADVVSPGGQLSLREAFAESNVDGDASEIELAPGQLYVLDLCALGGINHTVNATGSLVHATGHQLTINGNGATVQQTCAGERVIRHSDLTSSLVVNDLTVTGGTVTEEINGPDFSPMGGGGGIVSWGPLILDNVTATGNTSVEGGAGVRGRVETTITGSTITMNTATESAGGLMVGGQQSNAPLRLTMTGSSVSSNDPNGIFLWFGINSITGSFVDDNDASGVFADHGVITFDDTSLSNNDGFGAAGVNGKFTVLNSSVLSGNGLDGLSTTGAGVLEVTSSTVNGNLGDGLEFTGCNASEGKDNVVVMGSTISGNGEAGIKHPGCGQTVVNMSTINDNATGVFCVCEGATIEFTTIDGNLGGSGIVFVAQDFGFGSSGLLLVRATQVTNNTSDTDGGGIRAGEGFGLTTKVTVSESSSISGNSAPGDGGGIAIEGDLTVISSAITGNETVGTFEDPGGDGGGVFGTKGDTSIIFSTVAGNTADVNGGGVALAAFPGDQLSIAASAIQDNDAGGSGGGVFGDFSASVTLFESEVSGNTSVAQGGGIAVFDGAMSISFTHVENNTASAVGGGIYYRDTILPGNPLMIETSSITNNTGPAGGGIYADVRMPEGVELTNSTVSGNTGVGVETNFSTPIILDSSTIFNNEPHNLRTATGELITKQSVIALPVGGSDCVVPLATSLGYNFSSFGTCGLGLGIGDMSFGGDPMLGPLAGNGGFGLSHLPLAGSPLLNMVPGAACSQSFDQRLNPRPAGIGCEPGAIEVGLFFDLPFTIPTIPPGFPVPLDIFAAVPDGVLERASLRIVGQPTGGTAAVDGTTILYASLDGFVGADEFSYELCYVTDPTDCFTTVVTVEVVSGGAEACTINGTSRRDVLFGTHGNDVICGYGGRDLVFGLGGDDLIVGGGGRDVLFGGRGYDTLIGGLGRDWCFVGFGGGEVISCERPRFH